MLFKPSKVQFSTGHRYTYRLSTITSLSSRANGSRSTRRSRSTGSASRASLTTVTLCHEQKNTIL